jgi:N,N-dimethylformamidase beta subunit-like, C-terminal
VHRLGLVLAAALAFAAHAQAATLTAVPQRFSPVTTTLRVSAQLSLERKVGVRLVRSSGKPVGWIVPPSRRRLLAFSWNGRIHGRRVADGSYDVRLVYRSNVLATTPLRIDSHPPQLYDLHADNGNTPFSGDNDLLTTISPNGDGFRDSANISFRLKEAATVTMEVARTVRAPKPFYTSTVTFGRGRHTITWAAASNLNPRTYLVSLTSVDRTGNRIVYGSPNAFVGRHPRGVVVRIQGVDAGFSKPNYLPGEVAQIHIATDASTLTERVFQSGPEKVVTYADNQFAGVEVDEGAIPIDWSAWRSAPHTIAFTVPDLPSGLYYVELTAADGRVGYAPFVVRPVVLGEASRVLVVLPTNTWQAYNFQDVNGDGYGDTWYAGPPNRFVDLGRTYIARGAPPHFYRYDLPFLHWLYWSGKKAEFISDSDFDNIASGAQLAASYDLILFEGHEEYVRSHEYDVVQRFRDLGGNLIFLSANNFFWKVQKSHNELVKIGRWRDAGRPEAALIGVEYRANDDGQRQGLYTVGDTAAAPWFWDGTGLAEGSTFGQTVGGYGIEIDAIAPESPPGTVVLAQVPDVLGPGLTAQMSYYETPAGAKVFAAGTLDFGGSATFWPVKRMLDNLWARLSQP